VVRGHLTSWLRADKVSWHHRWLSLTVKQLSCCVVYHTKTPPITAPRHGCPSRVQLIEFTVNEVICKGSPLKHFAGGIKV
jgi:hypothetical protein